MELEEPTPEELAQARLEEVNRALVRIGFPRPYLTQDGPKKRAESNSAWSPFANYLQSWTPAQGGATFVAADDLAFSLAARSLAIQHRMAVKFVNVPELRGPNLGAILSDLNQNSVRFIFLRHFFEPHYKNGLNEEARFEVEQTLFRLYRLDYGFFIHSPSRLKDASWWSPNLLRLLSRHCPELPFSIPNE